MSPDQPATESQARRHFIELATRSLEDQPGVRDEARAELAGRLAHGGSPDREAELELALGHMAKVQPRRARWLPPTCWLVWLMLFAIAGWQTWLAAQDLIGMNYFGEIDRERMAGHLSAAKQEFLFARHQEKQEDVLAALERMTAQDPGNPQLYEDYAERYLEQEKEIPPGYRETWQKLDPENGMWPLLEAGIEADKALPRSGPVDEAHFAEALALFDQAAAATHFARHELELHRQRVAMLAAPQDMSAELDALRFAVTENWDGNMTRLTWLGRLVGVQAEQLAAAKDREGLHRLIAAWEKTGKGLAGSLDSMMDAIMFANFIKPSARALELAARDLGMAEEEAELQQQQILFSAAHTAFRMRAEYRMKSYLAGMLGPHTGQLDPALFEPGRRMEYAMLDRGSALGSALLLLPLLGGAIFEAYRRGRRVNGLAEGLVPVLRPTDGLWCLGMGVALPALLYLTITRLTPLGCRDWGAFCGFNLDPTTQRWEWLLAPVFLQAAAGLLLVLSLLVQVIRWRLDRRLGYLALRPSWRWTSWLPPLLAALLLPLSGIARWIPATDDRTRFLIAIAAATGLPLLWLLWQAAAGLGASRDRALGGVIVSRALILPLALVTALLLSTWLPLKQQEREWFAKDELTRSDRSHGGNGQTLAETRLVAAAARQYQSAFNPPDSP